MLREVEAGRKILALADEATHTEFMRDQEFATFEEFPEVSLGDRMLQHLAAVWCDHPDYDESWRP